MRSAKFALGLALSAGLAVSACDIRTGGDDGFNIGISRASAEDTWTRSYPMAPGGRLELVNVNGRIDAEPSSGTSIEVEGRRTAKASSDEAAKEMLDKVEMREEVGDNRVRIEVRPPRLHGISSHEVKWTIKVPKGVQVDLRNVNGGVRVTGLDGAVHAETTNGGVTGRGLLAGIVEASAVNGGIEIEMTAPLGPDGRVELETVNGGVRFELPSDSKATISARAVNGGVRVSDLDVQKTGEEGTRRRLEGTLNGGGARVTLQTTNGGVAIARSGAGKPTS